VTNKQTGRLAKSSVWRDSDLDCRPKPAVWVWFQECGILIFAALSTPAQCLDSQLHHTPVFGRGINSTEVTNMKLHCRTAYHAFIYGT